jgi:hypothetical protein
MRCALWLHSFAPALVSRSDCRTAERSDHSFVAAEPVLADLTTPSQIHTLRHPRLRLGLLFFEGPDANIVREMVRRLASDLLPWTVVDSHPYDAVLLARGPRRRDAPELALFRLGADAQRRLRRQRIDVMPTIALRHPLRMAHLKIVLDMATASLIPDHIERLMPHTQPLVTPTIPSTRIRT